MTKDEYYAYLRTPAWQDKRSKRLVLDNFTCQKCGAKKTLLDVHHINYERVGNEDIYRDLITLCRECHKEIEEGKKIPVRENQVRAISNPDAASIAFCDENAMHDYSAGGAENYCRIDVVKPKLERWLQNHGCKYDYPSVKVVLDYFSARRYDVIFRLLAEGKSVTAIERETKFKRKMIDKIKADKYEAYRRRNQWRQKEEMIRLRAKVVELGGAL